MISKNLVSSRWRVVAPAVAAGAALGRRIGVAAQDGEQRPLEPAGTPVARTEGAPGSDPLLSLLSLVPVSVTDAVDDSQLISFADIAAQLVAGGITPPSSVEDEEGMRPWIHASYPLMIAEPLRRMAVRFTRDLIGFDVTDLDQTLEAGLPPGMITLLRGRFDQAAVRAAWELNGYRMLEVDGLPVASLFEDAELDLENEIGRMALSRMNNAAFLPDGTLVYAATLSLLESVIGTVGSVGSALGQRKDVTTLLASLESPLASAMLVGGASFSYAAHEPLNPQLDEEQISEITEQMETPVPPIALGLVGVTPGGPTVIYEEGEEPVITMPPATIAYRLLMAETDTAETAAEVVEARLGSMRSMRTNQPWSELFGSWDARAVADGDVLALDLTPAAGHPVSIWPQMLFARDLLFLAW